MLKLQVVNYPYAKPNIGTDAIFLTDCLGDIVIDFESRTISGSIARLKVLSKALGLKLKGVTVDLTTECYVNPKKTITNIINEFK